MEKVLYDTSSLILKYRKGVRRIDGLTTVLNIVEFPKALEFEKLEIVYPNPKDYELTIVLSKDLLKIGKPIPALDIIIAAVALNRDLVLETMDTHFEAVKNIRREFKLKLLKRSCSNPR